METWLIYAIVSLFTAGIYNFGMKVITKRNYNTSLASIINYSIGSLIAGIYYFSTHLNNLTTSGFVLIILFSFGNSLFYFLSTLSRVKALHNIDTTIFFPLYKTFFPIIITIISYFILKENLGIKDIIGIVCGILVPLLLITKSENNIQKNLKLGLIFIIITSILTSISSMFPKMINIKNLDIELYIFITLLLGTIISTISYKFFDKHSKKEYSKKGIYLFGVILGISNFLAIYTFTRALEGNLAIVVTINSFSILIPIILSVIFYKEEMTFKKAFVIFLSVVSVILFI